MIRTEMNRELTSLVFIIALVLALPSTAMAQSVCLPAPRLLTTMPMGAQAGTTTEIVISGQSLDEVDGLIFSDPRITATAKLDEQGNPVANTFVVTTEADCPPGIYDVRVMARLGISSARAFTIGSAPEMTQDKPSTSIETAFEIPIGSVCNAVLVDRSINHYRFSAKQGQQLFIDCAAKGIDSRTTPVVIVADESGNDLAVERRGGAIDFLVPDDGNYIVKVHDLTYKGGPHYFFRLVIKPYQGDDVPDRQPSVRAVCEFSWPPEGLAAQAAIKEAEPNGTDRAQSITLPCDVAGRFYPAADVDCFEFEAKKGEVWWIEVASERLGRPTDPAAVVQQVVTEDGTESLVDVVQLSDIPSPVKRSTNRYAYDGPPYNAGSSDVLGKVEIKEDGTYRLQLTDLFGGTRNDPDNDYRLIVRKAAPDFAIVGWALHMELRNGDRNALSKPIALRGGATIPIEMVVVRRDGFDGEIELSVDDLPDGVTATGIKIGKGKNVGTVLLHADRDAPRGMSIAKIKGTATIGENQIVRFCELASMKWPVVNARDDIPAPRLLSSMPVSVGGTEAAAVSIGPAETKIMEVAEKTTLTIPMVVQKEDNVSAKTMSLSTFGAGFEKATKLSFDLKADQPEVKLDLAKLKVPPGDYRIAFYGGAVVKYQDNPDAVVTAETALELAKTRSGELAEQQKRLTAEMKEAEPGEQGEIQARLKEVAAKKKQTDALVASATKKMATAKRLSKPKDIVDIYVSDPIDIRVLPAAENKK